MRRFPERVIFTEGAPLTIAVDTKQEERTGRTAVTRNTPPRSTPSPAPHTASTLKSAVPSTPPRQVVVCGPRRSPIIAQMLGVDERYGFDNDENGWYLVDRFTNRAYRSPEDSGEPGDYAYLGRLPRRDGRGFWLYMAGIHAPGGEGAALYLEDNLEQLYRDGKTGRWSCLVQCEWDPKPTR